MNKPTENGSLVVLILWIIFLWPVAIWYWFNRLWDKDELTKNIVSKNK